VPYMHRGCSSCVYYSSIDVRVQLSSCTRTRYEPDVRRETNTYLHCAHNLNRSQVEARPRAGRAQMPTSKTERARTHTTDEYVPKKSTTQPPPLNAVRLTSLAHLLPSCLRPGYLLMPLAASFRSVASFFQSVHASSPKGSDQSAMSNPTAGGPTPPGPNPPSWAIVHNRPYDESECS